MDQAPASDMGLLWGGTSAKTKAMRNLLLATTALAASLAACSGGGGGGAIIPPFDVPAGVTVADFDGDGRDDVALAFAHVAGPPPHPGYVRFFRQSAAGVFDVPVASDRDSDLLSRWATAVSGYSIEKSGLMATLPDAHRRLEALRRETASAPLGRPATASLIRWFLSDPAKRPPSPLSRLP